MKWRRRADILERRAPDGVVVISLHGGDPVWLTAPGDAVWELLDQPRDLNAITDELASRFGASPEVVRADCEVLLGDLVTRSLVEVVTP